MGQALLVPSRKKLSIMSTRPSLWLSASQGIGTTGARLFTAANFEYFTLATIVAPGTSDFWLSWWMYRAGTAADHCVFHSGNLSVYAGTGGTTLYVYIGGTTYTFASAGLSAAVWKHCAINFDRDGLATLYVNGVSVGTADISAKAGTSVGITASRIGWDGGSAYMDGRLSRVSYGTGLLTDADVTELVNQGNGKFYAELTAVEPKSVHYWNLNESSGNAIDAKGTNDGTDTNTVTSAAGPREAMAADLEGGYHGVLTNMDTVSSWSTDTPDGSYTATKVDSVGTAHGTMTGFTDIDAAHVDGPDGSWGPHIPNDGSDGASIDGWLLSSVKDSRSANVPSSLNTRIFDEQYTEPASTGSRWLDDINDQRFDLGTAPAYGTGDFTVEGWFYPYSVTGSTRYIIGTGATSGTTIGLAVYYSSLSLLRVDVCNGTSLLSSSSSVPAITAYQWHHFAVVCNRTTNTMQVWLDGCLTTTLDISTLAGTYTPVGATKSIGAYGTADSSLTLPGAISRVRFCIGNALSAAEIAESYNGGKGREYSELSGSLQAKVTHSWSMAGASGAGETCEKASGNNLTVGGTGTISSAASPYLPAYDATLTGFTSSPRSSDVPTVLVGKCKSLQGGTDKYATTGQKTVTGMGARSVAFWFKRNGNPAADEYIISEGIASTQVGAVVMLATSGYIFCSIYDGTAPAVINGGDGFYTSSTLCDNQWHHVVFAWDGGTISSSAKVYVDGVLYRSNVTSITGTSQGGASTYSLQLFGYNGSAGVEYTGLICRPQIFAGRALTAGEVATLYAGGDVTEGLTAEWRFNEPDAIAVPFEHALKCDGSASRVDCGAEIIGTGAQTISGWVNASGLGGSGVGRICDNGKSEFNLYSGPSIRYSSDAVSVAQTVSGAIATGSWYHIAVARTATGHAQIFVNGNRVSLTTISTGNAGTPTGGSTNLYIGNRSDAARAFDGRIGQVRIDSGVLTQAQIRQLALGQSPATPRASWQFDKPLDLPYLDGCKAVRFDGVDDYITATNGITAYPFTIGCWVRASTTGLAQGLISIWSLDNTYWYVGVGSSGNAIVVARNTTEYNAGTPTIGDNQWHYVSAVFASATDRKLYVDGNLAGTDTTSVAFAAASSVFIGRVRASVPQYYSPSEIADPRIYSTALTQAQIRSLITGTDFRTGISAQWKFGETPRSIPSCAGGYSLEFSAASSHYIETPADSLALTQTTFSGWFKTTNTTLAYLFAHNGTNAIYIYKSAAGFKVAFDTADQTYANVFNDVGTYNVGEWTHVAFTYKSGEAQFYINGVAVGALVTTRTGNLTWDSPGGFWFGRQIANYYSGKLDDWRVYSSALSASDIALLASGGDPTTSPVAHWTFDDGPQFGEPSNGDPISVWESKDGGRHVFTQSTQSAMPTFVQSGQNGRPGLVFDGVDDYLRCGSQILTSTSGTIVIVAKTGNVTGSKTLFCSGDEGAAFNRYVSVDTVTTSGRLRVSQVNADTLDQVTSTNGVGVSAARILSVRSDGAAYKLSIDGYLETPILANGSHLGDWFGDTTLLDSTTIGGLLCNSLTQPYPGTIYEILAFDRCLSDVELRKVERILAAQYGITLAS